MSIRGPVMGTRYYTLDSVAAADGEPGSAHTLRTLAMSANRLLCTGETALTLIWDATSGASESAGTGMLRGYGINGLARVAGPIIVPKKPGLRTMEVNVTALIGGSETCDFLMTTRASPLNLATPGRSVTSHSWSRLLNYLTITVPENHGFRTGNLITFDTVTAGGDVATATAIVSTTSTTITVAQSGSTVSTTTEEGEVVDRTVRPGWIKMTGDGSTTYQHYAATGIPCSTDDFEELTFYVRGRPGTTLAASGSSSGIVDAAWEEGLFIDASATFDSSLPWAHEVQFEDSASNPIMSRRLVVERVVQFGGIEGLKVSPRFATIEARRAVGAGFKIYQLPTWRLACINVNTEDREA